MFQFLKKKNKENVLNIYHSYSRSDGYTDIKKSKRVSIEKFLKKSRNNNSDYRYGFINSKFNDCQYPVYDLDSENKYQEFLNYYPTSKYVIFRSSTEPSSQKFNHYWAIVDEDVKSVKKYKNVAWHVINDVDYVNFCKKENSFDLRFTYENIPNKPIRIKSQGDVSDNFKLFIKTFEKLINTEGLEISTLIIKDKELLKLYQRKNKLKKLI